MEDVIYIDTPEALEEAAHHWSHCKVLGIDTECENNLHYYGTYICIIQVSSHEHNWIVDVLALQQIEQVLTMLENPNIQKIFHDASFDMMILHHQFHCRPKNLFDTQLASQFLGRTEIGLGALLRDYFKVTKQNHFQMVDWTKRPLTKDMMAYAIGDTKYLIKLRDLLTAELTEKKRLDWVTEELEDIENEGLVYEEKGFMDFPGSAFLNNKERSVLKELFSLRKEMAKKANKPPYFVISTKRMTELVKNPPKSIDEWKNVGGVHPIVKRHAREFYDAVHEGLKGDIPPRPVTRIHYNPKQAERLRKLSEMREAAAVKHKIPKHLLLSKEQMLDVAMTGKLDSLRKWQKELFSGDTTLLH